MQELGATLAGESSYSDPSSAQSKYPTLNACDPKLDGGQPWIEARAQASVRICLLHPARDAVGILLMTVSPLCGKSAVP